MNELKKDLTLVLFRKLSFNNQTALPLDQTLVRSPIHPFLCTTHAWNLQQDLVKNATLLIIPMCYITNLFPTCFLIVYSTMYLHYQFLTLSQIFSDFQWGTTSRLFAVTRAGLSTRKSSPMSRATLATPLTQPSSSTRTTPCRRRLILRPSS